MSASRIVPACLLTLAVLLATGCAGSGGTGDVLRVSGSTTVNPVAADAAVVLRDQQGMSITVDTQGGSTGGLAQLCSGEIDIAMSSKPVSDSDRVRFPDCGYTPTKIGEDAVGIIVRREVFDGGVRTLTPAQVRGIVEARIDVPAAVLSVGQRQRLCLARALALNPALLLLDEPTSSLDRAARAAVEAALTGLRGHRSILLVSHDAEQVARLCDRAVTLADDPSGEVVRVLR